MPRPRRCRNVSFEPGIDYFKPIGIKKSMLAETILAVDEFEAVRLKDLKCLDQAEAAEQMHISQPTFHRLLQSARKKIADAIVNCKAIKIKGGNYKMMQRRTRRRRGFGGPPSICKCIKCDYTEPKEQGVPCADKKCPKCGGTLVRGD